MKHKERTNEELVEDMMNIIPCPTILYEVGTGNALYINVVGAKYFGVVGEKRLGKLDPTDERWRAGWCDSKGVSLPPDKRPGKRAASGESFSHEELIWKNVDTGKPHNVLVYGSLLSGDHLQPMGMVVVIDITRDIERNEKLTRALILRDEFLAVASHELRTPLTSLFLQVTALLRRTPNVPDVIRKRLEVLERSISSLQRLIENLMEVSELTRPHNLKLTSLDFGEVIRTMIERYEPIAHQRGVTINRRIPYEAIRGQWDRTRVDQIVSNLLNNAIKYGRGRPIEVDVVAWGDHVELRVRDYGDGVKPEDRERIFERYQRAVSQNHSAGMGLGLWLSAEAARSMGGAIWVEEPCNGVGSVFILHLPLNP